MLAAKGGGLHFATSVCKASGCVAALQKSPVGLVQTVGTLHLGPGHQRAHVLGILHLPPKLGVDEGVVGLVQVQVAPVTLLTTELDAGLLFEQGFVIGSLQEELCQSGRSGCQHVAAGANQYRELLAPSPEPWPTQGPDSALGARKCCHTAQWASLLRTARPAAEVLGVQWHCGGWPVSRCPPQ